MDNNKIRFFSAPDSIERVFSTLLLPHEILYPDTDTDNSESETPRSNMGESLDDGQIMYDAVHDRINGSGDDIPQATHQPNENDSHPKPPASHHASSDNQQISDDEMCDYYISLGYHLSGKR